FLQRQTTNDLNKLLPDKYVQTVLTTAVGRIVDVLTVFKNDDYDDCLEIITLPDRGASTINFLQKKIFFTDRVRIRDVSDGSV
ncbi:MAG: hypothetical protein GWO38_01525, partial [Phycisphaerae bacterium]|nr:hypothetical protein [Phycisphaerae bacterium]NIX26324.1 hypothetical protein [Phycisphaerae bacterium]